MFKFLFKTSFLILAGGTVGFILSIALGDRVAVRLSRVPLFKQYKLVSIQAPIVIHTREELRSRGDDDILAALERSKNKVSMILARENNQLKLTAGAVNLTGEGLFVSALPNSLPGQEKYIQLTDGSLRIIKEIYKDPASGLSILRAEGSGSVQAASFADSSNLRAGERILLLGSGEGKDSSVVRVSFVAQKEAPLDDSEAGFYNNTLLVQESEGLLPGQAVVNMAGDVAGLWNGSRVVPASVLGDVSRKFLTAQKDFTRPNFGFAFHQFSETETRLFGSPAGSSLVLRVATGGPAAVSGLKNNDVIISVGDVSFSGSPTLEERLLNAEAGKALGVTVLRSGKEMKLVLTPGSLK